MIISESTGDIFLSDMQTLVCPVNKVGVMGNGLAYAFRKKIEGLWSAYQQACGYDVFNVGSRLFVFEETAADRQGQQVLCFPTKNHWKNDSTLVLIEEGLVSLAKNYEALGITSLAVPGLGCGKGKLTWEQVRPIIWKHLDPLQLRVEVYEPT